MITTMLNKDRSVHHLNLSTSPKVIDLFVTRQKHWKRNDKMRIFCEFIRNKGQETKTFTNG